MVFSFVFFLFQLFLDSEVFSDRDSPNITITVANRCNSTKNYDVNKKWSLPLYLHKLPIHITLRSVSRPSQDVK